MSRATTGWYLHHQGSGHLSRFLAVRPQLPGDVVVFSSLAEPSVLPADTRWVALPCDDDGSAFVEPSAGGLLHWAPLAHRGFISRMGLIAAELATDAFRRFVVDVSVEVTLLARLMGVPTVIFGQPGTRTDLPHQLARRAATRIIAPWPDGAHPIAPEDRGRTVQVGGISRFDSRPRVGRLDAGSVLLLGGLGGSAVSAAELDAAERATPDTRWTHLGRSHPDHPTTRWEADPWPLLCSAEVVVSFAGQNAVADLAAAGARAVVIPQQRPFDEQVATARQLEQDNLAQIRYRWPDPEEWPDLLAAAGRSRPDWHRWRTDGAADRAARVIEEVSG